MTKINTIIFDMDGTVLDTLEDLMDGVNYALKTNNYSERSLEEVRAFVGNGVHKLIERAVPEGTKEDAIEEVFNIFKPYYSEHCMDKTKPYDGIIELMKELKKRNYSLAIVSNKVDSAVKELTKLYFGDLIDISIGERSEIKRKPAPDMVNMALKELNKEIDEAIYIGDSEVDYETAVNSKLPCISVLWGFRTEEFLRTIGANCFAKTPSDVLDIIINDGYGI